MPPSRFEKHKRFWITVVVLCAFIVPLWATEMVLRIVDAYDPFDLLFYTIQNPNDTNILITPYGEIRFNSLGYADIEFDLADPKPRVGYIGDSVVFGLGVGHGFRIADHLRAALPEYQHFSIGESGAGVPSPERAERILDQLGLDKFIYFLNLNDIQPTPPPPVAGSPPPPPSILRRVRDHPLFVFVDRLRERSRTYNMLRIAARNAMVRFGYDAIQGAPAYELQPTRYRNVIEQTASRVRQLAATVTSHGARFCVVLLPYEMQISQIAEQYYADNGIQWEDGFLDRSTQAILREELGPAIEVFDAYEAFVRRDHEVEDRGSIGLSEYYISRAGAALDWNHPNRLGHMRLAEFLLETRPCGL